MLIAIITQKITKLKKKQLLKELVHYINVSAKTTSNTGCTISARETFLLVILDPK